MTMADDQAVIDEQAQAILDEAAANSELPDMAADTKVTILNTALSTADSFVLGQHVEFKVVGYVSAVGTKLINNEGKREVATVTTTYIGLVDDDS